MNMVMKSKVICCQASRFMRRHGVGWVSWEGGRWSKDVLGKEQHSKVQDCGETRKDEDSSRKDENVAETRVLRSFNAFQPTRDILIEKFTKSSSRFTMLPTILLRRQCFYSSHLSLCPSPAFRHSKYRHPRVQLSLCFASTIPVGMCS
jgi:hypothetical protein